MWSPFFFSSSSDVCKPKTQPDVCETGRGGGEQRMEGQERREETETSKAGHTVNALDTDTEEKGAYRGVGGGGGGGGDSGE